MLLHVFFGPQLLDYVGITIPAFRVAGGILLLLIGIGMMRKDPDVQESAASNSANPMRVAFVSLAVPLTAGPGTISAVIVYSHLESSFGHLLVLDHGGLW